MLVGERHDEAIEPLRLQLLAKGGKAGFMTGHNLTSTCPLNRSG
jgi:hypothetical protein